jgi:hypothetical protein
MQRVPEKRPEFRLLLTRSSASFFCLELRMIINNGQGLQYIFFLPYVLIAFFTPRIRLNNSTCAERPHTTQVPLRTRLVASGRCAKHGDHFRCQMSMAERMLSGKRELVGERYALGGESASTSILLSFLRSTPSLHSFSTPRPRHENAARAKHPCLTQVHLEPDCCWQSPCEAWRRCSLSEVDGQTNALRETA